MAMVSKHGRMDSIIKDNTLRTENTVLVNSNKPMEQFIEVLSKRTKCTAKVKSNMSMVRKEKANGKTTSI